MLCSVVPQQVANVSHLFRVVKNFLAPIELNSLAFDSKKFFFGQDKDKAANLGSCLLARHGFGAVETASRETDSLPPPLVHKGGRSGWRSCWPPLRVQEQKRDKHRWDAKSTDIWLVVSLLSLSLSLHGHVFEEKKSEKPKAKKNKGQVGQGKEVQVGDAATLVLMGLDRTAIPST